MGRPSIQLQAGLVMGIDIGTQGARVIVADGAGQVIAQASHTFPPPSSAADGGFEQDPRQWQSAVAAGLREVTVALGERCDDLAALAITATSGTICPLDERGRPLRPALMYSDRRATAEAAHINSIGQSFTRRLGYRFDASFGLPKLLWLQRNEPDTFAAARYFAHAADVLIGQLTGDYGVSDWSHALKSGYDLIDERWPDFIETELGLPLDHFPRITRPGAVIGQVSARAAEETGLPVGLAIVAGMTDSCASQIAGGATEPGQWLSVLGTTLVFRGVTAELLRDPQGRVYSHRHPMGMWLPGGASSTGGETLARRFAGADLVALDRQAAALTPSGVICYPLERVGERFPFARPDARGFLLDEQAVAEGSPLHYTACLEGVAYLERLGYTTLEGLGARIDSPICITGGGARSQVWSQIRADVLERSLLAPEQTEAAFGAAVLAASAMLYPDLSSATRAMTRMRAIIEPRLDAARYQEHYARFVAACRERGYLDTAGDTSALS